MAGKGLCKTSAPLVSLESRIVQVSGRRSWLLIGQKGFASRKVLIALGEVFGCLGADA